MITGVVLARNEESNIVECLHSLKPHVNELFVIDMESDDGTVALATPIADRILRHPIIAQFDAARNVAFEEARFDWLWFVDADERIPQQTGDLVNHLLRERGDEIEAINIPFRSYFCSQWMQHCGWWPGYTSPRVLKKGHCRFSEVLHGSVEHQGRELQLPPDPELAIEHYSYRDLEHYLEKANRYTSIEAGQLHERGIVWNWRTALHGMVHDLWEHYEKKDAAADGDRGWVLTWLSSQYRWLSIAKLIDRQPSVPEGSQPISTSYPADLDEFVAAFVDELAAFRCATPRLPLGVVWRAPAWELSGYGEEARSFLSAIAEGSRDVVLEPLRSLSREHVASGPQRALLQALERAKLPHSFITVSHYLPPAVTPDPRAVFNVLRTTFETDQIPAGWSDALRGFDEIWVTSRACREAFHRSGAAPERLRIVPEFVDTERFSPLGPVCTVMKPDDRFLFLSVFDWQLRKGWDVLVSAYLKAFPTGDVTRLLLKVTGWHNATRQQMEAQLDELCRTRGTRWHAREDIVLWTDPLSAEEMPRLYRAADTFVLASRGEGWGRPYAEAMAAGVPVISPCAPAMNEYLDQETAFLVNAQPVVIPERALAEISAYRSQGTPQHWWEPDEDDLRRLLVYVREHPQEAASRAARARERVCSQYSLEAGRETIEKAVKRVESRLFPLATPRETPAQLRVQLEGELFAGHSFSNVNEQLGRELARDETIALRLARIHQYPVADRQSPFWAELAPRIDRPFASPVEVTIRHTYPPNWEPPETGRWVHIQPWEYGSLPVDWIGPLRDRVDEIWVPSTYVRNVYVRSGIPTEKIHVIPWGVDPERFHVDVPARLLPTKKRFKFLFVGGLIRRKGFDEVLNAYCEVFSRRDDVCLVVKDLGSSTFYRDSTMHSAMEEIRSRDGAPELIYLDEEMTPGQLASLYAACNCLVAPSRGEGFGLPVLEAMACGVPAIVLGGCAMDDFVSESTAFVIPTHTVSTTVDHKLCDVPTERAIPAAQLRTVMRLAYHRPQETQKKGVRAAESVRELTWQQTANRMARRLWALGRPTSHATLRPFAVAPAPAPRS